MDFIDFGFEDELLDGIEAMGYKAPTPIQEQVIPYIIEGRDIIASAQTGTGKTAAFLLPVLHRLTTRQHASHKINALILVPTRELAIQISQILEGLSYYTPVSSIAVYGGGSGDLFATEKKALSTGADIVICTPGRMISHLNMGYVKLEELDYLILDEADRMLDMGFYEDIVKIISFMPKKRQNLMFSATMPSAIRKLANLMLVNPVEINIAVSKPPEQIKQAAFIVFEQQKIPLIKHVLQNGNFSSILIFCSSKLSVKQLTAELRRNKLPAGEIHSDLEQEAREQALIDFKNKKLNILVATDILSRGIHIDDIDLVINFNVPGDGEDYVHRIGRTARAESKGTAYTFINEQEQGRFKKIEKLIGRDIEKLPVPESFGPTPQLSSGDFRPRNKKNFKNFKRK